MSAFISIALDDRILLMSDTAVVDGEGRLCALSGKTVRWNMPPMAIAIRGLAGDAGGILQRRILPSVRKTTSFDHALERVRASLRWARPVAERATCILLLAGIQANGRPAQHVVTTGPSDIGIEPLCLTRMDDIAVCGNLDADGFRAAGLDIAALKHDPIRHGPAFFQAFRRPVPYPWSDGKAFSGVGGQLQLTTITAAGCEWRTIAYWPDWLEQPIDPKRKFVPVL